MENHTKNYAAFVAEPLKYCQSNRGRQDTELRRDTDDFIDNFSKTDDQTEITQICIAFQHTFNQPYITWYMAFQQFQILCKLRL